MVMRKNDDEEWMNERFLPKKRFPRNGHLGKSVTFSKEIEKTLEVVDSS
jgi:hypothetical protein